MQQEGWSINVRGRLITPAQNEEARRVIEEASRTIDRRGDVGRATGVLSENHRAESYNKKLKGKDKAKEESDEDDDPHFIEEDAVFEFWLANIWKEPGTQENVLRKKKQFSNIWRGLCGGKD
jgi:hypothetical protein